MQAPKLSHDTLVAFCSVPSPIVRFEQYIAASCVTAENVPLPMIVILPVSYTHLTLPTIA